MSECLHKLIRWPESQIKERQNVANLDSPSSSFPVDFTLLPRSSETQNSYASCWPSFEHTMEGLPPLQRCRAYIHKVRQLQRPRGPCRKGLSRADKVTLFAIQEAKE